MLERIAKEGRKYGVSLGLITQRPSDLAEGVLSQCGTIISMRLNNERDQAFVKSAMPEGARGFLDVIPALRNRECVVCGEGVSIPIRVTFDDLERDRCPASSDPIFSELWKHAGDEEERWSAASSNAGARKAARAHYANQTVGLLEAEAAVCTLADAAPGRTANRLLSWLLKRASSSPLSCGRITNLTMAGLIGVPLR